MTAQGRLCRAVGCAASAALSHDAPAASQFMKLAVRWRAVAVQDIFLSHADRANDLLVKKCGSYDYLCSPGQKNCTCFTIVLLLSLINSRFQKRDIQILIK